MCGGGMCAHYTTRVTRIEWAAYENFDYRFFGVDFGGEDSTLRVRMKEKRRQFPEGLFDELKIVSTTTMKFRVWDDAEKWVRFSAPNSQREFSYVCEGRFRVYDVRIRGKSEEISYDVSKMGFEIRKSGQKRFSRGCFFEFAENGEIWGNLIELMRI